ncbi:MAG: hypothetical protein GF331_10875 [Chitinivibrionales bacterium]|nr:hypothetical protein [Chitinivibrionales bacterium]
MTMMRISRLAVFVAVCVVVGRNAASVKSEMDALTGNVHTRVVWQQGGHYYDGGGKVLGYDSHADATHTILPEQSYRKPILCSGGNRVVVSSDDWKVYVVDFSGSGGKQFLLDGFCSDVWVHPQTGQEWLFVRHNNAVKRHLLGDPSQSVHLYSGSAGHSAVDWWSVSADGTAGADFLPWADGYFIDDAAGLNGQSPSPQKVTGGCWASFSCENSYYWFHLDGDHHYIKVFRLAEFKRRLYVNAPAPSNHNAQIYHPRFASKGGHYMTCSAGYDGNGASNHAEICLGKFNSDYSGFVGWVKVTSNSVFDNNGDAWVGVTGQEPSIVLSPESLSFEAQQGGANPSPKTVTVSTPVGSLSGLSVSDNAGWLTASLSGATITNSVNLSGLSADVHTAQVTVTADNANPSTATYTVTLSVVGAPVATSLTITPADPLLLVGATQQFTATVLDQYGNPMSPQPPIGWSASGSAGSIDASGMFSAAASEGTGSVTANASGLSASTGVTVVTQAPVAIRINCGGPAVDGWESDQAYVVAGHTGASYPFGGTHDVSGVTDPAPAAVYQTVRHQDHRYSFADVPNGTYTVRIHFTDAHEGNRAMDYSIEGQQVLSGFNVTDAAGGTYTAVVREFPVQVSDGNGLQIVCESGDGNDVFEAGIEVLSGGDASAVISIAAPTAGDTLRVGEAMRIEWTSTQDIGMNVRISADDGENWVLLNSEKASPTTGGTGSYEWTVQQAVGHVSLLSGSVQIRVSDYWDEAVYAVSEHFTIAPAAPVVVSSVSPRTEVSDVHAAGGLLRIAVVEPGAHRVTVVNSAGRCLVRLRGEGRAEYCWNYGAAGGVYFVRVEAAARERVWTVVPRR